MVDWSPFGGNPVPGDPAQVKVLAHAFHSFADDVDGQNSLLKALKADTTGVWEGPAADAFRPHLDDLPPKLDKLVRSYRETGDALTTYAPKLQTAQDDALAALKKATEAMTRLGTAQTNKANQDAANKRAAAAATPDHPAPTVIQPDYGAAVTQAKADLDAAHRAKDAAVDEARRAAKDAVNAIKQAANDGIKNKHHHWWDTVVDVITHPAKLLKVISMAANFLSGVFGILALITCWIPGVGEFFEAASLATGLIGLVADTLLATFYGGSWASVLTDAVAVGTAGVGHVLGEAAGASRAVAEGESTLAKGETALSKSAELKSEARTLLQTGKGGRSASAADKATAAAKRLEAGKLTTEGKALTKEGQAAIKGASNPVKYGVKESGELPNYVSKVARNPAEQWSVAVGKAQKSFETYGVKGTAYNYVGYGDPSVATWVKGSVAVGAYSTSVTVHASNNDFESLRKGTLFDKPGSIGDQLHEFENNVDPFVLAGAPKHGPEEP